MTPERWKQVNDLFHAVLDQPPDARERFLRDSTGDDLELRREVESLLRAHASSDGFLDTPAWGVAPELMFDAPEATLSGRTLGAYKIAAIAGFTLFGLGLAFYATPSTDAALSALPDDQAGSGAGLYKMASSLGASFGVAISATVFTALSDGRPVGWMEGVISYAGRQDNVAVREAAFFALAINLLMVVAAIASIVMTIPGRKRGEEDPVAGDPMVGGDPAVARR